jgi:hypothetical protein
MRGAISLLPFTPSWREEREIYLSAIDLPLPTTPLDEWSSVQNLQAKLNRILLATDSLRKATEPVMVETDSAVLR